MASQLLPRLFTHRNMLGLGSLILKVCIFLPLPLLSQDRAVSSANIPFSFSAGSHAMPAGDYVLYRVSDHMYSLRSRDGSEAQSFTVYNASSTAAVDSSRLVFHQYGDQHFLASLWFQGARDGFQIRLSKPEKEVLAATRPNTTPNVLIALRSALSPKP